VIGAFGAGAALGRLPIEILRGALDHANFGYYVTRVSTEGLFLAKLQENIEMLHKASFLRYLFLEIPRSFCFNSPVEFLIYFLFLAACCVALVLPVVVFIRNIGKGGKISDVLLPLLKPEVLGVAFFSIYFFAFYLVFAMQRPNEPWSPEVASNRDILLMNYHYFVVLLPPMYLAASVIFERMLPLGKWPNLAGKIIIILLLFLGFNGLADVLSFPPEEIADPSCVNYNMLENASIQAIRQSAPEADQCPMIEKYAASFDPAGAEEICRSIEQTQCSCPFK